MKSILAHQELSWWIKCILSCKWLFFCGIIYELWIWSCFMAYRQKDSFSIRKKESKTFFIQINNTSQVVHFGHTLLSVNFLSPLTNYLIPMLYQSQYFPGLKTEDKVNSLCSYSADKTTLGSLRLVFIFL